MAMRRGEADLETTDVIICGCGPTGALLSGLLGRQAVKNVVLEKEKEVVTDPRGIALDSDGIRLLQELGLYDKIHTEIAQHIGWALFTSGRHGLLTKPFMQMNTGTTGGTGHVGGIAHKQPIMEKYLRLAAGRCPSSQLRLGSTVVSIEEDENWVYAKYVDDGGSEQTVRGKFLVGADGKTGYTRKRYLEPRGVLLQTLSGYEYSETWVAMNWHMDLPTQESHPEFPLWQLDYSPQQVYDTFFPPDFRFIGNPDRPAVCGTFGLRSDRLWRFEFVVDKEEDPQEMSTWKKTAEIVLPYVTHPGSRYGLKDAVQYPIDCIHVLRSRPFSFAARSCNKWAVGRILLCGDAAHVMPPFGGQGIASGFRDASGIAWRLALACRPTFSGSYEEVFNGWFLERKQQLDLSLASTVANGNLTTARNPLKIFLRDWLLWLMQLVPSWKQKLELGPNAGGMGRYKFSNGMAFLPDMAGGRCLPQVYCRPVYQSTMGGPQAVQFTDDVLLDGSRANALLRLLVVVGDLDQAEQAWLELRELDLDRSSNGEVQGKSALFLVQSSAVEIQTPCTGSDIPPDRVYRTATADEFAASDLCKNRPYPTGYDMHRIQKELNGRRFILVRPDRFVYAACDTGDELLAACELIPKTLLGSSTTTQSPKSKF